MMKPPILDDKSDDQLPDYPFGPNEELAIASLMLDHPEFFTTLANHIQYKLFSRTEVQYVVAKVMQYYDTYQVFPTRGMLLDLVKKELTADDIGVDDILAIINRPSDPREIPAIKDNLIKWAKKKSYELLFTTETYDRFKNEDYDYLDTIFNEARTIQDIGIGTFWFFDEIQKIFQQESVEKFTTGFHRLDIHLHNDDKLRGPARKEMLVWMAPTGVGKSIMLVNNAIENVKRGRKVLYVTLEMSSLSTACRALGILTNSNTSSKLDNSEIIMKQVNYLKSKDGMGDFAIHELQPDEASVDTIYALVDMLKKNKSWIPDIICVDYLELMISRRPSDNTDEYKKQKSVSTQLRGLAAALNVLIFTATQTNRSGNERSDEYINVSKMAESYGKAMPMDYLISINQSKEDYESCMENGVAKRPAPAVLFIAKNRNGPKSKSVPILIDYRTFKMQENLG